MISTENPELDQVLASENVKELEGIETFGQLVKWFFNPKGMKPRTILTIIIIIAGLFIGIFKQSWWFFFTMTLLAIISKSLVLMMEWNLVKQLNRYRELQEEHSFLQDVSEDYQEMENAKEPEA